MALRSGKRGILFLWARSQRLCGPPRFARFILTKRGVCLVTSGLRPPLAATVLSQTFPEPSASPAPCAAREIPANAEIGSGRRSSLSASRPGAPTCRRTDLSKSLVPDEDFFSRLGLPAAVAEGTAARCAGGKAALPQNGSG